MSDSKHCVVHNCNTTSTNKAPYVNLHSFPTSSEMRNKWLHVLRTRCSTIDWSRSKICSNHFEPKFLDTQRQLKSTAIPTRFPKQPPIVQKFKPMEQSPGYKLDKLLNKQTQSALQEDIKSSLQKLKIPENIMNSINEDLKCSVVASTECQLWLLLKKQEHLINRLNNENLQNKKHIEVLQKNMEEFRSEKKEMEQSLEHFKYIAKCLQEKHATLEEQIEILTAVETR